MSLTLGSANEATWKLRSIEEDILVYKKQISDGACLRIGAFLSMHLLADRKMDNGSGIHHVRIRSKRQHEFRGSFVTFRHANVSWSDGRRWKKSMEGAPDALTTAATSLQGDSTSTFPSTLGRYLTSHSLSTQPPAL